nr:hypothetical protein [Tanacetum cinerariifolium]
MYTIVWRNIDDLDTMSLDDVYNHLKVYEPEVQKKSKSNSQNMAFISSSNTSSGKGKVHTASVPTASIQVSTASTDVAAANLSHDTIDKDDIEEIDIKWNMALLSMRADRFWKKTGKKITVQGSDVAGFDKTKVECFNCHKMGHFAREYRAPRSQDREKRESYKQVPKEEEPAPKALMAIDNIGWNWSYMANEEENMLLKNTENLNTKISKLNKELSDCETDLYHYKRGLSEVEARLVEFKEPKIKFCKKIRGLERDVEVRNNKIEYLINELEQVKKEKEGLDNKLTGFESASKDLDNLLGSERSDKNKERLPEFVDDTVTDYRRPTPSIDAAKCNTSDHQSTDCPRVIKTNNTENARKSIVKYAKMYMNISKSPKVRGNQRNWNNLKSQQLGKDFLMQNKACFKCGHFDHLAFDCGVWVEKGKTWTKNNYAYKNGNSQNNIDDKGYWDSGCSRHITGNISYLSEYEPYDGRYVSFGLGGGKITDFKLKDDTNVLLKTPRQHNMYSIDLNNIVPLKNLTCLVAKASVDESMLWHRRVLVNKSQNKTPYELFNSRTPAIRFLRPFGCHVMILNSLDHLGKFDVKWDEVVVVGTSSTNISCTKDVASHVVTKDVSSLRYIALPNWFHEAHMETSNDTIRNSDAQDDSQKEQDCNVDVPENSGISNPTVTLKVP